MLLDHVDANTSEDEIVAWIDVQDRDALVPLLAERSPIYAGRSTNAAVRLKGYVLAAFERVGLPGPALPYVLEELESGRAPYLVAAAAKAGRGLDRPAAHLVPFLLKAIENIRYLDDALSFDGYWARWPAKRRTTALDEILTTIAWLGADAAAARPALETLVADAESLSASARATIDSILARIPAHVCCSGMVHAAPAERAPGAIGPTPPLKVEMEDQDGHRVRFEELVTGRPSIVTFFYTRCENPNKCSLTITKLARLQQVLADEGLQDQVRTLAITYDPEFDVPPRLRAYGENRGVMFGPNHRLLRSTRAEFDTLRGYFELGVNYGPALVNMHRIELFVLDQGGRIHSTFTRLQWDPDEVLHRARSLLEVTAPQTSV